MLTKNKAGTVGLENNGEVIILDQAIRDGFPEELPFEQEEPALQRSETRLFQAEELANAKAVR